MAGCGWVICWLPYYLPRFTTVVCHISVRHDFLQSPLLFYRHSVNLFVSRFYSAASKGLPKYVLLYASYRLFDWSVRPGTYFVRHPLDMRLLDASNTS